MKHERKGMDKIISIPYLAQAVMAIALQRPESARARPSSLLKDENNYKTVFSKDHPIQLYVICALMMKPVDSYLRKEALNRKDQTKLRFYVAMLTAMKLADGKPLTPRTIARLPLDKLIESQLVHSFAKAKSAYKALGGSDQVAKGAELVKVLNPKS